MTLGRVDQTGDSRAKFIQTQFHRVSRPTKHPFGPSRISLDIVRRHPGLKLPSLGSREFGSRILDRPNLLFRQLVHRPLPETSEVHQIHESRKVTAKPPSWVYVFLRVTSHKRDGEIATPPLSQRRPPGLSPCFSQKVAPLDCRPDSRGPPPFPGLCRQVPDRLRRAAAHGKKECLGGMWKTGPISGGGPRKVRTREVRIY